jgi:hypothetical protein
MTAFALRVYSCPCVPKASVLFPNPTNVLVTPKIFQMSSTTCALQSLLAQASAIGICLCILIACIERILSVVQLRQHLQSGHIDASIVRTSLGQMTVFCVPYMGAVGMYVLLDVAVREYRGNVVMVEQCTRMFTFEGG